MSATRSELQTIYLRLQFMSCNISHTNSYRDSVLFRARCHKYILSYLEEETWIKVPFLPGYMVSSIGRVKHLASYNNKERILCPSFRCLRYMYVTVTHGGKRKGLAIHRLVIASFHNVAYSTIRKFKHLNGIPYDNRISNLSYSLTGK